MQLGRIRPVIVSIPARVIVFVVIALLLLVLPSCDLVNNSSPAEDSPEDLALDNAVLRSTVEGDSSLGSSSAPALSLSPMSTIAGVENLAVEDDMVLDYNSPYLWTGDDSLSRKDVLANPVGPVPIAAFEITADVHLYSSETADPATLMSWGGDPAAEPMVDLMSGTLSETRQGDQSDLRAIKYETVYFQLNAAGDVLTPEGEDPLELTKVLPFSVEGSAQVTVFSTFIDTPFVTYLEAPDYQFDPTAYQTLVDAEVTEDVSSFGEWNGIAPLTQEYFDAVALLSTDDPPHGAPTLFMPLPEPIDLTNVSDGSEISFRIEILFKELLSEYYYEHTSPYWEGNRFFFLSPFRTYTDTEGNTYYGPLPLRVTYEVEG